MRRGAAYSVVCGVVVGMAVGMAALADNYWGGRSSAGKAYRHGTKWVVNYKTAWEAVTTVALMPKTNMTAGTYGLWEVETNGNFMPSVGWGRGDRYWEIEVGGEAKPKEI